MAYAPDARPLGDLFSDLMRDITILVRSEMALARAEMGAKMTRVRRHVGGDCSWRRHRARRPVHARGLPGARYWCALECQRGVQRSSLGAR